MGNTVQPMFKDVVKAFMSEDDPSKYQQLLHSTYNAYRVKDPEIFDKLSEVIGTKELADYHEKNNLSWPIEEDQLVAADGYFNKLTADQAKYMTEKFSEFLPILQ